MVLKKYALISFVVLMLVIFVQGKGIAEIYKHKDENGNWQFTDKPAPGEKPKKDVVYKSNDINSGGIADYKKSLNDKYNPDSPLSFATLAVLKIESRIGSGSGFFVSNDCYLITNKHVVRPTNTKKWKESEEKLKDQKENIKNDKQYISDEKQRLGINKRKLKEFREYIDGLRPSGEKNNEEKDYKYRLTNHEKDLEDLDKKIITTKAKEKNYKKKYSVFSTDSSLANISNTFKVILKDDTEAQAKLIKLSKDEDLALLKIDKCISPFLVLDETIRLQQGTKIFAVGSPLGLTDHVTAGIVTNVKDDEINIDAQILPGNSGGPLITPEGNVVGVNTFKMSANGAHAEGFGIAISTKVVLKEFSEYLQLQDRDEDKIEVDEVSLTK